MKQLFIFVSILAIATIFTDFMQARKNSLPDESFLMHSELKPVDTLTRVVMLCTKFDSVFSNKKFVSVNLSTVSIFGYSLETNNNGARELKQYFDDNKNPLSKKYFVWFSEYYPIK